MYDGSCYSSIHCDTESGDCSENGICEFSVFQSKFICGCNDGYTGTSCDSCKNNVNGNRDLNSGC